MVTPSSTEFDNFGKCRKYIRMTDAELAALIGRNVRAARTAAGLTQLELAGKCGMAMPHVSRLEKGTHLPSVNTLKKVSDALKVPICQFLDPPTGEMGNQEDKK